MSHEHKEGGCCGSEGSKKSCCGTKKLIVAVVAGALLFMAGMLFAKTQCGSKICPLSAHAVSQ
jgi:hypothetical protein